jgi:CO dehydrogenase maturation factor
MCLTNIESCLRIGNSARRHNADALAGCYGQPAAWQVESLTRAFAMKLAITGKGGAGKTTVAVFLSRRLADSGREVILVDADPDANAALALGLDASVEIPPLIELKELIEERTGVKSSGGFFSLTPKVDDIPARYAVDAGGVKLIRMGRLKKGGTGCMCPENAFVRSLLAHLVFEKDSVLILDMEAGVEHLGRGTAQGVDMMLVVVEPGKRSIQTALAVRNLAADIGIKRVGVVINKYRSRDEMEAIAKQLGPLPIVGRLPYDENIASSDLDGVCAYRGTAEHRRWADEILEGIAAAQSAAHSRGTRLKGGISTA